jgi:UDPglucose 6-dehydrogenase
MAAARSGYMKIAVAGLGFVGTSMAVLLSQHNRVVALDIDGARVEKINRRISPIADGDIQRYLSEEVLDLTATTDIAEAFGGAEYVIIATPTDYDPERDTFDTRSVEAVITSVLTVNPDAVMVIKSTVPVGYTEKTKAAFGSSSILFSPEFLREGKALRDNLYPARIVVGERSDRARVFAGLLVGGAVRKDMPVLFTGSTEAEAIKLFANTYLAMRVAYFNELDSYAEVRGLDARQIIDGVGLDPRIGGHYNNPSFGYGGYCLPKDTRQLLANFGDVPQNIMSAVVQANSTRKEHVAAMIMARNPRVVGVYRLVMKTDSENFRQSAVLGVMEHLIASGANTVVYEPALAGSEFLGCRLIKDLGEFKNLCDVIVANRLSDEIADVAAKVYTRDLFSRD